MDPQYILTFMSQITPLTNQRGPISDKNHMNRRVDLWTPLFPGFVPVEFLVLQRNIETRKYNYEKSDLGRLLHQSTRFKDKLATGAVEVETLKYLVTLYMQDFSILFFKEEV
jgi:hypothetical protein